MPEETSDEVMNFIRLGESPARSVKRKVANALSTARGKFYDTVGPLMPGAAEYVPADDPRRQNAGFWRAPGQADLYNDRTGRYEIGPAVHGLSVSDMPGFDLFDPSPAGEISAMRKAGEFIPGAPRKFREVMDLVKRFEIEGWNRGQVVEELARLGHNPTEFMDLITSRFSRGNMLDAPPLSEQFLKTLDPGNVDPSFGMAQKMAMEERNAGRDFARGLQATPEDWGLTRDVSESFRKMGQMRADELGLAKKDVVPGLDWSPGSLGGEKQTISQMLRSPSGKSPANFAYDADVGGKKVGYYNLTEDIIDPLTGQVKHSKGSTVSEGALELYGVPKGPAAEVIKSADFDKLMGEASPAAIAAKRGDTPRAGARTFNEDTAQSNIELYSSKAEDLDEDDFNKYQDIEEKAQKMFFQKVNPNQHDRLQEFMDLMVENRLTMDDAIKEMGKRGADRNTQRRLIDFWNFLGSE